MIDYKVTPFYSSSQEYMSIKILDSKELVYANLNGIKFTEISDLAYKNDLLFMLSDKAYLYKFNIAFKDDKIFKLDMIDTNRLKSKKGKLLKKKKSDSEGLDFLDDKLLISFERKHRVSLFSLNAVKIKEIQIHKKLRDKDNYRAKNRGLEALVYSDRYGVITAPELSLKTSKKYKTLYGKKRVWNFKADGHISALELINKESVLVLLREVNSLSKTKETTLLSVSLEESVNGFYKTKVLARLSTLKGWRISNAEGLTKVGKNRFLMINDDDGDAFQKTVLTLFEIKE